MKTYLTLMYLLILSFLTGCGTYYVHPAQPYNPYQRVYYQPYQRVYYQPYQQKTVQKLHKPSCRFKEKTIVIGLNNGVGKFIACQNNEVQLQGNLSAGQPETHRTPRGDFRVLWKKYEYDSKKYPSEDGKRNMDRAIFFTSEGHAIHIGNTRRYSHGCVRVKRSKADWLYNWSDYQTRVIVQDL